MHTDVLAYSKCLCMLYSFYIAEKPNAWEGMLNLSVPHQLEVGEGVTAYPPVTATDTWNVYGKGHQVKPVCTQRGNDSLKRVETGSVCHKCAFEKLITAQVDGGSYKEDKKRCSLDFLWNTSLSDSSFYSLFSKTLSVAFVTSKCPI